MPYNENGNFDVSTFDDVMNDYYNVYVSKLGYTGTFEEFKQGKFGALHYASVQLLIRSQIETSRILEKAKDFYRIQNAIIATNNLNPVGIQSAFKSKLGLDVSLDSAGDGFGLAVDYTPTAEANQKIAKLLATECYAYDDPLMMKGDISQGYQDSSSSQSFVMKWRQKQDKQVRFHIAIAYVEDTPAPIMEKDDILKLFLTLWDERYVWGNTVQPQRIMTESDVPFAASVAISHDGGDPEAAINLTTPLDVDYFFKVIPVITVNDIVVTKVV